MLRAFILVVLPTIQLDAETQRLAIEIQDIGWQRMLAAELMPGQLTITQVAPEQRLNVGGFAPELTGKFERAWFERGFAAGHGRSPFLKVRIA